MGPRQSEDMCPRQGSRNYKESSQASPGGGGTSRAASQAGLELQLQMGQGSGEQLAEGVSWPGYRDKAVS